MARFEMSPELINEIIFAMENQGDNMLLDSASCVVVSESEIAETEGSAETLEDTEGFADPDSDETRYQPIPKWGPADGFRLMEQFVGSLRNPIARDELRSALSRGKGVFRAYKDSLQKYPEIEKLWFKFKEDSMRLLVRSWYDSLRESWGLERLGEEPEETGEIVESDFSFRHYKPSDLETLRELDRTGLDDAFDELTGQARYCLEAERENRLRFPPDPGALCLIAESSDSSIAAFVLGTVNPTPSGEILCVTQLAVKPEFRGLGLGEELLDRFIVLCSSREIAGLFCELPGDESFFSRVLERNGFACARKSYYADLRKIRE